MKIAFLGTGIMGAPMAARLCRAGYAVWAWNRSPEKAEPLKAFDAEICATAQDAAASADIVILMVSTGDVCNTLLFGEGQPVNALRLKPGCLVIVMSSIAPDTAKRQAGTLSEFSIRYIDAPVSGGEEGAKAGSLSIMAGGAGTDIETARPVFNVLGETTHVGPVSCGQVSKLANQLIVGVTIGAVAEALILAKAGGADPKAVREALFGGFADSAILRAHGLRMLEENFTPGAHATTQLKDLAGAKTIADRRQTSLPFLSLAHDLYEEMCGSDLKDVDHSGLYRLLQQRPPAHFNDA